MRAIDVFEFFVVFVLYIPTMLSLFIYFSCFKKMKDNEFKYFIFPMALLIAVMPFLNILSLMCISLNCFDNNENVSKEDLQ